MGVAANLVVKVAADVSDFQKQMATLEKSFARTGAKLQSVGANLTKGITLPLVAVGGYAAKAAMDFESSFAGIRKTVAAATDSLGNLTPVGQALAAGMREMATTLPVNVNELNRIGESAGQLGIKAENILSFTRVVADLGATTNLTTEQAATQMARLANITGMPQTEFSRLGSTIVDLGNNFATTESEILEFGLRIAGAGALAGLTEAQILGIGTAMSSVGVEAEAGGTAVQKVLLSMVTAVTTGNKDLAVFNNLVADTGQTFTQLFKADPGAAFTAFVEGLGKQGNDAIAVLDQLGLSDQRLVRSFLSLANAGDLLTTAMNTGTQAWAANSALTKEAEQRYRTTASQLQILWNRVTDVAITLGQQLLPALMRMLPAVQSVLSVVAGLVDLFSRLPGPVQTGALAIAALAAAIGPLIYVAGTAMQALSGLASAIKMVVGAAGVGGGAAAGLGAGLLAPILAIGAAVPLVVKSFVDLYKVLRKITSMPPLPGAPERPELFSGKGRALPKEALGASEALELLIEQSQKASVAGKNAAGGAAAHANALKGLGQSARDVVSPLDELVKTEEQLNAQWAQQARVGMSFDMFFPGGQVPTGMPELMGVTSLAGLMPTAPAIQGDMADLGTLAGDSFGTSFGQSVGSAIARAIEGGGNILGAVGADIGNFFSTKFGESITKSMGGWLGGLVGNLVAGLGALLGPLLDKIWDALTKTDAERAVDEIGREWGVTISEAMGEQIEETMKTKFKGMKNNRWMAEVFNLGDIITDIGGVTDTNFAALAEQARQAFVFLDEGAYTAADVAHVLDTSFGAFVKHLEESGGIARAEFQELIALTEAWGVKSEEVAKFVAAKHQQVVGGLMTFLENAQITSQASATAFAGAIVAVFDQARRQGSSIIEALQLVGPAIDKLKAQLGEQGLAGGPAFNFLASLQKLATGETTGPLFAAIDGINQMLLGLNNTGILTAEMFTGLTTQVTDTFNQLLAQGVNGNKALMLIQPTLQTIWELQRQFGYAVDAGTQALLDQAVAAGLVGEQRMSTEAQMLDVSRAQLEVFIAIADVMGATIPDAIRNMGATAQTTFGQVVEDAQQAGQQIQDAFRPNTGARPPTSGGGEASSGYVYHGPQSEVLPKFQTGGIVRRPTVGLIGEDGPEAIIPLDRAGRLGPRISVHLHADHITSDDAWIEDRVTQGVLRALEKNRRSAFTKFQTLVGQAG